jgi:hypothetical protein
MEKMLINERFKSPNKEFEKVFNLFRKKDYFDEKSQVKRKQEEFVRFLKKGDPMATKVFKQNKENMKSSLSFIEDMVMDYNKKNHFEAFKIFSTAVNDVEMKDSKSAEKSGNFIKSKIHNNSQKYSLAIYSAIRKQKFNNYKDVHKDVDELISKNEGFSSDAQRKAAFANGYEEKGKKNEGKKRFKRQDGIGKAKYTISYHDGKKKHKDGSDFFDIKIFKNKKDLSDFVGTLAKQGYKLTRESVNEILVIVDKFDKRKQDYDKVYYQDGGKRPGDGDINKAQKQFAKLSKKHKGLTLISVDRNSKMYDVNESVNEGKYNYKADALTAYFKGKIDAKELDRIARDDFKSGIATKKELSNFLSNKFTQDVMSDTYGIPAGTLIKRVRGLMKFAEGKDDGVPQGYNPMVEDKKQIKDLVKKVKFEKIFYDVLDTMEKKYGKRKYRIWLEKSLKDFGINPKHYDYRTNAAAEEKLFQLGK